MKTLLIAACLLASGAACAQTLALTDAPDVLPWGAYVAQILLGLAGVIASGAGAFGVWVFHRLVKGKESATDDATLNNAIKNAITGGIGTIATASLDKTMTIETSNKALRAVIDWFKTAEPELMAKYGIPFITARLTATYATMASVPDEAALPVPPPKGQTK